MARLLCLLCEVRPEDLARLAGGPELARGADAQGPGLGPARRGGRGSRETRLRGTALTRQERALLKQNLDAGESHTETYQLRSHPMYCQLLAQTVYAFLRGELFNNEQYASHCIVPSTEYCRIRAKHIGSWSRPLPGQALYGLQSLKQDSAELRGLARALIPKVICPEFLELHRTSNKRAFRFLNEFIFRRVSRTCREKSMFNTLRYSSTAKSASIVSSVSCSRSRATATDID